MRRAAAWASAWLLFGAGHIVSVLFLRSDLMFNMPAFRFYQWAMGLSSDIQDWGGLSSPWGEPNA